MGPPQMPARKLQLAALWLAAIIALMGVAAFAMYWIMTVSK